jgi:hypothetical protein
MSPQTLVECRFFIPIHRDKSISDGDSHPVTAWQWLHGELFEWFNGRTNSSAAIFEGDWKDEKGERVYDTSREYIVALPQDKVDELRKMLAKACSVFFQKCIYLSVKGDVEFVYPDC